MGELTGPKVLAITVGAFGVIIAVNLVMAYQAVSTFPGLEVDDSYVASQTFDAERAAQLALGWHMVPAYRDGVLSLGFFAADGGAVALRDIHVLVGRPTEARQDQTPTFAAEGTVYRAAVTLSAGKWMLMVTAHAADGTLLQQRVTITVPGDLTTG